MLNTYWLSEQTRDVFRITKEIEKVHAVVSSLSREKKWVQRYEAMSLLTGNEFTFLEHSFKNARFSEIPEDDVELYVLAGVGEVGVTKYEQAIKATATALDNNDVQTAAFWTKQHFNHGKRTDEEQQIYNKYLTPARTGKIIGLLRKAGMLNE